MSTRGAIGFIYNNISKIGYIDCDAYIAYFGDLLIKYLRNKSLNELITTFNLIEEISEDDSDDEQYRDFWDIKHNVPHKKFINYERFLTDSLYCEYAYIINLDTQKLEVYEGFNEDPNAPGRYANKRVKKDFSFSAIHITYYGVKLVEELDLIDLFKYKYYVDDKEEKFLLKEKI